MKIRQSLLCVVLCGISGAVQASIAADIDAADRGLDTTSIDITDMPVEDGTKDVTTKPRSVFAALKDRVLGSKDQGPASSGTPVNRLGGAGRATTSSITTEPVVDGGLIKRTIAQTQATVVELDGGPVVVELPKQVAETIRVFNTYADALSDIKPDKVTDNQLLFYGDRFVTMITRLPEEFTLTASEKSLFEAALKKYALALEKVMSKPPKKDITFDMAKRQLEVFENVQKLIKKTSALDGVSFDALTTKVDSLKLIDDRFSQRMAKVDTAETAFKALGFSDSSLEMQVWQKLVSFTYSPERTLYELREVETMMTTLAEILKVNQTIMTSYPTRKITNNVDKLTDFLKDQQQKTPEEILQDIAALDALLIGLKKEQTALENEYPTYEGVTDEINKRIGNLTQNKYATTQDQIEALDAQMLTYDFFLKGSYTGDGVADFKKALKTYGAVLEQLVKSIDLTKLSTTDQLQTVLTGLRSARAVLPEVLDASKPGFFLGDALDQKIRAVTAKQKQVVYIESQEAQVKALGFKDDSQEMQLFKQAMEPLQKLVDATDFSVIKAGDQFASQKEVVDLVVKILDGLHKLGRTFKVSYKENYYYKELFLPDGSINVKNFSLENLQGLYQAINTDVLELPLQTKPAPITESVGKPSSTLPSGVTAYTQGDVATKVTLADTESRWNRFVTKVAKWFGGSEKSLPFLREKKVTFINNPQIVDAELIALEKRIAGKINADLADRMDDAEAHLKFYKPTIGRSTNSFAANVSEKQELLKDQKYLQDTLKQVGDLKNELFQENIGLKMGQQDFLDTISQEINGLLTQVTDRIAEYDALQKKS